MDIATLGAQVCELIERCRALAADMDAAGATSAAWAMRMAVAMLLEAGLRLGGEPVAGHPDDPEDGPLVLVEDPRVRPQ